MGRLTRREGVMAALGAAGLGVATALVLRKPRATVAPAEPGEPEVRLQPASAIVAVRPPASLPAVTFRTLDGTAAPLSAYAGRPVVLNFWASWCVPCVTELPELDRLAAEGSIAVLAVSADRGGASVVRPFLASHALRHATVLLDPGSEAVHALQVAGFPTTFIIGPDQLVHGVLQGPASWGTAGAALRHILS